MAHPLRLLAEDAEDLAVISAAVQDAVAKIGDIHFDAHARTLTIGMNRYRWEKKGGERVRAGLQISSVLAVKQRNLRQGAKDAVVDLLAVVFEPREPDPSGTITLEFAGGADLRCEVECVDVVLADTSLSWPTPAKPRHED
jgi:hypothetical protein